MFSRLARRAIEIHKPLIISYQPASALSTSAIQKADLQMPTDTSKRDLVNFPRLVREEYPPPVRHIAIPESWFQYMYPKTGYTGPYMLFFGLSTFLLSKEIVVEHGLPHVLAVCIVITFINNKFGDAIGKAYTEKFTESCKEIDEEQEYEKQCIVETIDGLKKSVFNEKCIDEMSNAKKENVLLQMENIYRQRLADVYKKVKKQLDFQVELENVERRVLQKNLADYVIRNVLSSITPEQEKKTMQMCISNLNTLSGKI